MLVNCPTCQRQLTLEDSVASGTEMRCPACQHIFAVPSRKEKKSKKKRKDKSTSDSSPDATSDSTVVASGTTPNEGDSTTKVGALTISKVTSSARTAVVVVGTFLAKRDFSKKSLVSSGIAKLLIVVGLFGILFARGCSAIDEQEMASTMATLTADEFSEALVTADAVKLSKLQNIEAMIATQAKLDKLNVPNPFYQPGTPQEDIDATEEKLKKERESLQKELDDLNKAKEEMPSREIKAVLADKKNLREVQLRAAQAKANYAASGYWLQWILLFCAFPVAYGVVVLLVAGSKTEQLAALVLPALLALWLF